MGESKNGSVRVLTSTAEANAYTLFVNSNFYCPDIYRNELKYDYELGRYSNSKPSQHFRDCSCWNIKLLLFLFILVREWIFDSHTEIDSCRACAKRQSRRHKIACNRFISIGNRVSYICSGRIS